MFWLLKKIFGLGVFVAVLFFALQLRVGGRPLKDYLIDFYRAPLVQEAIRQGREVLQKYLHKDVGGGGEGPAMEKVSEEEKKELEQVLERESR